MQVVHLTGTAESTKVASLRRLCQKWVLMRTAIQTEEQQGCTKQARVQLYRQKEPASVYWIKGTNFRYNLKIIVASLCKYLKFYVKKDSTQQPTSGGPNALFWWYLKLTKVHRVSHPVFLSRATKKRSWIMLSSVSYTWKVFHGHHLK